MKSNYFLSSISFICFLMLISLFSQISYSLPLKPQSITKSSPTKDSISCHFKYDSKGNPEEFTLEFLANTTEKFLIGQMTVQVKTKTLIDKVLAKKFTSMDIGIWDDAGSIHSEQPQFYSNGVLVGDNDPVEFIVKVRNMAFPENPETETYFATCQRK